MKKEHPTRIYIQLADSMLQQIRDFFGQKTTVQEAHIIQNVWLLMYDQGMFSARELTEKTGIARTTVTRHLQAWIKKGLLEEVRDQDDGRKRRYRPTAKADRIIDDWAEWASMWTERIGKSIKK